MIEVRIDLDQGIGDWMDKSSYIRGYILLGDVYSHQSKVESILAFGKKVVGRYAPVRKAIDE